MLAAGCDHAAEPPPREPDSGTTASGAKLAVDEQGEPSLVLTSPAFQNNAAIPVRFSCDGDNLSPQLDWTAVPGDCKSLALICDDPDAPGATFVHWVIFNIPASQTELAEGVPLDESLPSGAKQGKNDLEQIGYEGACPPPGPPHHYRFKLYALDVELSIAAGAKKDELLQAMDGHIVATGELVGTFQRE